MVTHLLKCFTYIQYALRYLYFEYFSFILLYFYSTTFQREILYFLLHYIYLKLKLPVTLQIKISKNLFVHVNYDGLIIESKKLPNNI